MFFNLHPSANPVSASNAPPEAMLPDDLHNIEYLTDPCSLLNHHLEFRCKACGATLRAGNLHSEEMMQEFFGHHRDCVKLSLAH